MDSLTLNARKYAPPLKTPQFTIIGGCLPGVIVEFKNDGFKAPSKWRSPLFLVRLVAQLRLRARRYTIHTVILIFGVSYIKPEYNDTFDITIHSAAKPTTWRPYKGVTTMPQTPPLLVRVKK